MKKIFGFWIFLTIIIGIESVKQIKQSKQSKPHYRFIRGTAITAEQIQQHHRATEQQSDRTTAGQQQYSYHRLNSTKLFLQYGVTSMAEWEMNRTTRIIRTLCVACKRVKATRPDHLCDECRARHKGWSMWQHYKGSSKSRGYGYAWNKLRLKALERDKHLCQMCLKRGIFTTATDVDHIVPLAQGGSDEMENLQSLCHECHKQKTCQERLNNKNYLHDKT